MNNIKCSVNSENHDILLSGSVITFLREDIIFRIGELSYTIKFEMDHFNLFLKQIKINDLIISGKGLHTKIIPISVDTINNKKLYLVYGVEYHVNNRIFHYTWYLER